MKANPSIPPSIAIDAQSGEHSQRPIFRASAETVRLTRRLLKCEIGDIVSYEEIEEIIGLTPITQRGRAICLSAIRRARHEAAVVFECVAKTGYKRCSDKAILDVGVAAVRRIGRAARLGKSKVACADPGVLGPDDRVRLMTQQTVLAAIAQSTDSRMVERVRIGCEQSGGVLPFKSAILQMQK